MAKQLAGGLDELLDPLLHQRVGDLVEVDTFPSEILEDDPRAGHVFAQAWGAPCRVP